MARGSALARAVRYFEEADLREARVAFQVVKEVMEVRLAAANQAQSRPVKRRARKAKVNSPVADVKAGESLASA